MGILNIAPAERAGAHLLIQLYGPPRSGKTYTALRIARGDRTPLPAFEQEDFVRNGGFGERSLANLAEEFGLVRNASVALFRSLREDAWPRRGVASQKEVTVRALAFITAGHQIHHRAILEYLNQGYAPFHYRDMERLAAFQNRVFAKYARAHNLLRIYIQHLRLEIGIVGKMAQIAETI